jgi:hypothetical protein
VDYRREKKEKEDWRDLSRLQKGIILMVCASKYCSRIVGDSNLNYRYTKSYNLAIQKIQFIVFGVY